MYVITSRDALVTDHKQLFCLKWQSFFLFLFFFGLGKTLHTLCTYSIGASLDDLKADVFVKAERVKKK